LYLGSYKNQLNNFYNENIFSIFDIIFLTKLFRSIQSRKPIYQPKPVNMRNYLRLLVPAVIVFSLLFAACRNEPKIPNGPVENIITARISGDPANLNFVLASDGSATEIFKYLSVPMASFDPETYQLTPTLIKQLPVVTEITEGEYQGKIAYDFEILAEATWDNGTPVTAEDFLFTIKTVLNPNYTTPHGYTTGFIDHFIIDTENSKKFRVYGRKYIIGAPVISNFEAMPKYLYDPEGLLDKYTIEELKAKENQEKLAEDETLKAFAKQFQSPFHLNDPAGISYAGPYKIEKWTTGQEIVLVKKKNWWGDKLVDKYPLLKANPDKIIFKVVRDINAAISLAKNGELDIISKIPWSAFVPLQDDAIIKEQFDFHTPKKIAYRYIALNNNSPKLEDKRVRQALDYLFNREEIFKTVYFGSKTPTIGPIHPTKPYYNKNLSIRSFDETKAKALLKEAGWADSDGNGIIDKIIDGEKIEMNIELLYANGYEDFANIIEIFKSDALKAGINITPKTIDSQNFMATQKSRDFETMIAASEWYPLHQDLASRFHTRGGQNYSSFSNEEADVLIMKLRSTIDEAQLPEGYLRMQEIIHEEVPSIFINTGSDRIIINKRFNNVRVTSVKPHYYLNEFVAKSLAITASKN